ncbi:MAG: TetR/AcrR family transcriptional regulator [Anaerotignum sp.]|nr:TetR/AcrR family transcriptional regulator [Erysipelotrichaceae bacterium]MBR2544617.1 TetR/AcrR family transcriptional regulator [Erysipelotrichaceae bacterium]MBR3993024.1 TetR/AcrR family transcriptional regulator [Anaerotignum sp.]MBR4341959.1 TetR/AcrR family transcriptional regulator [Lachnospiraceae bacterium]
MAEKLSYAKTQLTDALLELLKNKKLNEITVSELCDKAQLSRLSFYRNYSSFEDIIRQHLSIITDGFLNSTSANYRTTPRDQFITLLFEHMYNIKDLVSLLIDNDLSYLLKEEFDSAFTRSVGIYDDPYRCYVASGAYFNLFYYWFINGCKETPAEVSQMLKGFLI